MREKEKGILERTQDKEVDVVSEVYFCVIFLTKIRKMSKIRKRALFFLVGLSFFLCKFKREAWGDARGIQKEVVAKERMYPPKKRGICFLLFA